MCWIAHGGRRQIARLQVSKLKEISDILLGGLRRDMVFLDPQARLRCALAALQVLVSFKLGCHTRSSKIYRDEVYYNVSQRCFIAYCHSLETRRSREKIKKSHDNLIVIMRKIMVTEQEYGGNHCNFRAQEKTLLINDSAFSPSSFLHIESWL